MKKLYLASASPRRHEILDIMNLPHTILTADADENIDTSLSVRRYRNFSSLPMTRELPTLAQVEVYRG
jgi:predicted house-cleaning NTP pyrophosphatase (Maf/HAM1 superfamily)